MTIRPLQRIEVSVTTGHRLSSRVFNRRTAWSSLTRLERPVPLVSNYYGIAGPVPFADVDVSCDNWLFLDPHAVRLTGAPEPFASEAIHSVDTFLGEIVRCVVSGDPVLHRRGESLLQRFREPWETRLGMSSKGFYGHGGGEDVGTWIWKALVTDLMALVRVGVLEHLEELPMFVDGVDRDITSDIATRIMFAPLARFTESMIAKYPEFTAGEHRARTVACQVWDPTTLDWTEEPFTLPVAGGKPLLLVPVAWTRRALLMSATRFYEKAVLDFAQLEQAVVGSDGKLIKTPKDELMKQAGLGRGRNTNIRLTLKAFAQDENLIAYFKSFVAAKFDRNDNDGEAAAA